MGSKGYIRFEGVDFDLPVVDVELRDKQFWVQVEMDTPSDFTIGKGKWFSGARPRWRDAPA
jgi:hypothetical protein